MRERIERCLTVATEAGRDPSTMLISTAFPGALAEDAETADQLIRRRAERFKVEPDEVKATLDRYEIPHGTPEQAAARFAAMADAGITRIYLQLSANNLDEIALAVKAARRTAALVA